MVRSLTSWLLSCRTECTSRTESRQRGLDSTTPPRHNRGAAERFADTQSESGVMSP